MSAPKPYSPETLADRIERRGPDDCWNWKGPSLRSGYGNAGSGFHRKFGTILAHRVAYLLAFGYLPEAPLVLRHTCDNRLCCNPSHMKPGSHEDNMRDMVSRGRSTKGRPGRKGEQHPRSKLSDREADAIRKMHQDGFSNRQIATRFPVSHVQVGRIVNGRSR